MQRIVLFAAAIALVSPAVAEAQSAPAQPAPPIVATSCSGTITSIELVEHASYDATFENHGAVAADDIHVVIPYGRKRKATFDVHDDFEPGTPVVEHLHKNLPGGLFAVGTNDDRCAVEYVHFVNGATWGTPAM